MDGAVNKDLKRKAWSCACIYPITPTTTLWIRNIRYIEREYMEKMWKNMKNGKMHKSMREQSSGFYFWRKWVQIWFWSFWEALYFFDFRSTFLNFWPALRHQGWCQNIAQRSPKLFGKTSFLTLQTFLEHVRNMSKKCILTYHNMSYNIISYNSIQYDIIDKKKTLMIFSKRPFGEKEDGV